MGKILEIILGKTACLEADQKYAIDDQKFNSNIHEKNEEIKRILISHGFNPSGKERMMDGTTGRMINADVMVGVVSYAKLNHIVGRKAHARDTGPVNLHTRQPNEGRLKSGGFRCGTMEFECMMAHASSEVIRERSVTASDQFRCYICNTCGNICDGNPVINYFYCRICESSRNIHEIELGYASKLMRQELMANGIHVSLKVDDN